MAAVDLRYARAFAAVVAEQRLNRDAVQGQLHDFAATLESSRELREVLENPSIAETQKLSVLDAIAAKLGMVGAVRNFIAVITQYGRLHELSEILAAYAAFADEELQIAEAEITTARPLDAQNRSLLERQVAQLAGGSQVRATYREDASLLGGAVVRIGSTVYDGSVRAQLQQLKQRLMAAHA
ncbi:MAG TPA: ATP synthase F1 subunit delta [Acidobacteriaceae bacterium]|jgi:F-type H+-transporting ATPase subunit delta